MAEWEAKRQQEYIEKRTTEIASLQGMPYRDYLKTDHWALVRKLAHERDGAACRICGSTENLNVHHRTYERRGDEDSLDVITLCQPCHEIFHANGRLAKAGG